LGEARERGERCVAGENTKEENSAGQESRLNPKKELAV